MHEKPKNRDWVKNAAIIFLAVLLVLTFFSNTIMNRSLPEVATQEVTSGSIVARVRGTGTVTANSNTQVKMEKTRVIRSVLVKVGQKVESGDVLFTLGEGSSEDIEAAETTLRNLQASYNRTAASVPQHSYTTEERKIDNLRKEYESAIAKVDEINQKISEAAQYQDGNSDLSEALERLAAAELLKNTAEELYNQKVAENEKALNEAKEAVSQYPEAEIAAKQGELVQVQAEKANYDTLLAEKTALETAISELESAIYSLEEQIKEIQTRIDDPSSMSDAEKTALENEQKELEEEQNRLSFNLQGLAMDDANREEINRQYSEVTEKINEIKAKLEAADKTVEELETEKAALIVKRDELNVTLIGKKAELSKYDDMPEDPASRIETLNAEIAELMAQGTSQSQLEEIMKELGAVSQEDLNNAIAYLEKCQAEVDALQAARTPKLNDDLQLAKVALNAAEDAYLTALESLNSKKLSDQQTDAGYGIDLANTWAEIEQAKRKLADLTGGEEAQILARVSGTIQTIDCSPGDTKQKDDVICTIEAPDMGYSLSFTVTNDQANRLRPGDTATVSNFYWGTEIVATLNSIKVDPKNPQSNKLLTFDLSGNVTAGSELTLSVGQKSANYDVIIPSSSIRTDANGSFVLKVEAKNSPLGNRYTARRVPVEVLASDDSNSAVSADLGFGDYVITTSSAPIKSGELVRLAMA